MAEKKCAIYVRVSTEQQAAKGHSLKAQLDECRAIAKRAGWNVVAEFADKRTGTSMSRAGLEQLFDLVATTPPDIVLMPRVDRAARDMLVFATLRHTFQEAGVELRFGDVPASSDPVTTELSENILASIAAFEK